MQNKQHKYTNTRTSKQNCTRIMQPSGIIRHAELPEVVLIQFISPDDEHEMLETCREL
jgi:hypothetical protein